MKSGIPTLVLFSLLWCGLAWAQPVHIPDPGLKGAIESELWVTDPTTADMLGLFQLSAQARNIRDLTGIEYAVNLQELYLRFNKIGSVWPLSGLVNLTYLCLNDNDIGDVSPLGGLINLYHLDLHDNQVSDVSGLAGLTNLSWLALRENPISNIGPLGGLPNLGELSLMETNVSDLSPLAGLTSLRYLDVRGCPLSDGSLDVYIPQIRASNPGIEIEIDPYRGRLLTLSSTYGGSVVEPGEGEFVFPFDALVHLRAEADPGFVFVGWTGPFPMPNNPADIFMERSYEFRAHFQSLRDTLYVDDDAPAAHDPSAGGDGTPELPIASLQGAIEVAAEYSKIIVRPGVYRGNINLSDKKVDLLGVDASDPHAGPRAIIEGTGNGPVVRLAGAGSRCSLTGFVITKGRDTSAGGVYCSGCNPKLSNLLIVGNRSTDPNGGAVYICDSDAVLTNCTIANNYGGRDGAALMLFDSNITMTNSIVWDNRPNEIICDDISHPSIRYCAVRGWWPGAGNVHSDPLLAAPGYWADPANLKATLGPQDARGVWMDGDYHLKSQAGRWEPVAGLWTNDAVTSPSIDAGDRGMEVGYEPSPNGGVINMGAYGGTSEASKSR